VGYIIPLHSSAALDLSFSVDNHQPMDIRPGPGDTWVVGPIRHVTVEEDRVTELNQMVASAAIKEIYGTPQDRVSELRAQMSSDSPPWEIVEPTLLAPFRDMGDSREFMNLVWQVQTKPSEYYRTNSAHPRL
jgi:hypothetical protein